MRPIRKTIIRDESDRPVAVQIDYREWLDIERRLEKAERAQEPTRLAKLAGAIRLTQDPVAYQRRAREEWP